METNTTTTTFYAGPLHNRRFKVPDDIVAVTAPGGHYTHVKGARKNEWYWMEGPPPLAIRRGGDLVPVMRVRHPEAGR